MNQGYCGPEAVLHVSGQYVSRLARASFAIGSRRPGRDHLARPPTHPRSLRRYPSGKRCWLSPAGTIRAHGLLTAGGFFGGENREAGAKIKTHLVTKYGACAGTGSIRLFAPVGQDMPHQLQVSRVGRIDHFDNVSDGVACILPTD